MGELEDLFRLHRGRMVTTGRHYFEVYERRLGTEIVIGAAPVPDYRGEATLALDEGERQFIAYMDELRAREPAPN